ncbi:MAG TPA: hypothetical protein VH854_13555 [Thermoanaerobaculia bacterium]|nr:hypothetical protein [Thermoanaerobaculia bacterium]
MLAVSAATLLPPDGDGLPFFDDNDADSDGLSLVVRISHAALLPAGVESAPLRIVVSLVAASDVSLPDAIPSPLLPSRSPPRS